MTTMEWVVLIASLAGFLGSAWLVSLGVHRLRRSPDDAWARFSSGWLWVFGLCAGFASCAGILLVGGPRVGSSWLATGAVVAVNLLIQPLALLFCWMGLRKVVLGVCGCVVYGCTRIPDAELDDMTPSQRRSLSQFCVMQGLIALPCGLFVSVTFAFPLLLWALA